MKAAVYYETGGPDVFRYEDVPDPVAGPGDLLVQVEAVSIEGGDTLNRLGGGLSRVPHIVGYQCAGTVAEVGSAVQGFAPGDRVVTVGVDGSHAALRAVPAGFAWRIPDGLSTPEAACVPARRCSSTPGPGASASPPSSWPRGPGPGSSPPPRATRSSVGSASSASTRGSTTPPPTSWPRCVG